MSRTLVSVPKTAKAGEIVDIRAMIAHPMETGYRMGPNGQTIPRKIIRHFACDYDGEEVFAAEFHPAMSANPFVAFSTVATKSGTLTFRWTDDDGKVETASAEISVS